MSESSPSTQRLAYLRARKRRKAAVRFAQLFLLIAFFGLWELSARMLPASTS